MLASCGLRRASLLAPLFAAGCPSSTGDKDDVDDTGTPVDTEDTDTHTTPMGV